MFKLFLNDKIINLTTGQHYIILWSSLLKAPWLHKALKRYIYDLLQFYNDLHYSLLEVSKVNLKKFLYPYIKKLNKFTVKKSDVSTLIFHYKKSSLLHYSITLFNFELWKKKKTDHQALVQKSRIGLPDILNRESKYVVFHYSQNVNFGNHCVMIKRITGL